MPDGLVRVRENGQEFNVGAAFAKARDLTVIDEPTHNDDGTPRGAVLTPQKKAAITRAANTETSGDKSSSDKQAAKPAETAKE